MNRLYVITFILLLPLFIFGQAQVDFEEFNIEVDSFLNGSDMSGGFYTNLLYLPNNYNSMFNSWSGWAISASTDSTTRGFGNQFGCISGHGNNNSDKYAISYAFDPVRITDQGTGPRNFISLYMNNATYTYWSMSEGDGFAKKFGGVTGDDPDYYYISIHGYLDGELTKDSVNFFLADFRFDDNSKDYIVNEWTKVDLSSLGLIDSLEFTAYSSDIGQFGINTPTYFCVDDIDYGPGVWTNNYAEIKSLNIRPTVGSGEFFFQEKQTGVLRIVDANGRLLEIKELSENVSINIPNWPSGKYHLVLEKNGEWHQGQVVKL